MPALAELLGRDQAAKLARLALDVATAPPPPAEPTAAVCPTCGAPRPAPAAVFRQPAAEQADGLDSTGWAGRTPSRARA